MKKNGYSLIEVIIAVTILSLAVFPFMNVIASNSAVVMDAKKRFKASFYAKELIEEIKLKNYEHDLSGTTRLNGFNDIEDYNGYTEKNEGIKDIQGNIRDSDFYRVVTVQNNTSDLSTDNTKRVTVQCFYNDDEMFSEFIWYIRQN